jgi:hypothetical protein
LRPASGCVDDEIGKELPRGECVGSAHDLDSRNAGAATIRNKSSGIALLKGPKVLKGKDALTKVPLKQWPRLRKDVDATPKMDLVTAKVMPAPVGGNVES